LDIALQHAWQQSVNWCQWLNGERYLTSPYSTYTCWYTYLHFKWLACRIHRIKVE